MKHGPKFFIIVKLIISHLVFTEILSNIDNVYKNFQLIINIDGIKMYSVGINNTKGI